MPVKLTISKSIITQSIDACGGSRYYDNYRNEFKHTKQYYDYTIMIENPLYIDSLWLAALEN